MGYLALILIGILVAYYLVGIFNWMRDLDAAARRHQRDSEYLANSTASTAQGRQSTRSAKRPPLCLEALGLDRYAAPDEVLDAYRQLALEAHPDRGGDQDEFKRLHRNFEQAMAYAEGRVAAKPSKPR